MYSVKFYFISLFLCLGEASLFSNPRLNKYWIFFNDKQSLNWRAKDILSQDCIANRLLIGLDTISFSDLPLNPNYLLVLQQSDVEVCNKSKWLNACTAYMNPHQVNRISNLPFVKNIQLINQTSYILDLDQSSFLKRRKKKHSIDSLNLQIEASEGLKLFNYQYLSANGLTGKGVKIGIVDAGYSNLDKQDYFKKVIAENRVVCTRDFLMPNREVGIFENLTGKDTHGREVAKCIGGKSKKEIFGVAYDALFYLARTENAKEEKREEEDAWVAAMEWFDSLGVRLVNSSLGYGKGFDRPDESYKNTQMNGFSTVVARAAWIATLEKEMIIVNSAGNSGNDKEWSGFISSPADVPPVISVGATDSHFAKMGYSSIGPDYNGYIKPDIAAFSKNGTSFSSPLITGIVACILQNHADWCNDQIKDVLFSSCNLYPNKNNYIGFGVPDCNRLINLMDSKTDTSFVNKLMVVADSTVEIDNKYFDKTFMSDAQKIVVFHCQNPGFVIESEVLDTDKSSYIFKRKHHVDYTILLSRKGKLVITWPLSLVNENIPEEE